MGGSKLVTDEDPAERAVGVWVDTLQVGRYLSSRSSGETRRTAGVRRLDGQEDRV